jgi:glycosyltransferase involved in cell wall biosynthesis
VTGLPAITPLDCGLDSDVLHPKRESSKTRVGFPHRWAPDKQPHHFIKVMKRLSELGSNYEGVVLMPSESIGKVDYEKEAREANIQFIYCPTKADYWRNLALLDVVFSSAQLETFGYAVLEGVIAGAVPVVPAATCYPHLYRKTYISLEDAAQEIRHVNASRKAGVPLRTAPWTRHLSPEGRALIGAFDGVIGEQFEQLLNQG